jgi:hypothetical protein
VVVVDAPPVLSLPSMWALSTQPSSMWDMGCLLSTRLSLTWAVGCRATWELRWRGVMRRRHGFYVIEVGSASTWVLRRLCGCCVDDEVDVEVGRGRLGVAWLDDKQKHTLQQKCPLSSG